MYYQVASKLVVSGNNTTQYSQAVSMAGGNAIQVDATAFSSGGGTMRITVQEGNDIENWSDVTSSGSTLDLVTSGTPPTLYNTVKVTAIASQYVRLKYTQLGAFTNVVGAGVNVANL